MLVVLAACGEEGSSASQDDPLDGRTFVSTDVSGHDLVPGSSVRLAFSQGQVSASAGCNSLGGTAVLRDGVLVSGAMSMTEMGCEPDLMAQDAWLVDFLGSAPAARVDETTLTLTTDDVTLRLTDQEAIRAEDPVPFDDTTWTLESFVDGAGAEGSVSSVPGDDAPTLVFSDGAVAVFTGCNRGRAAVTVGADTLEFGDLALTRKACPGAGGANEAAVTAVLRGTVAFEQEYDVLTLTSPTGAGLVYRATR